MVFLDQNYLSFLKVVVSRKCEIGQEESLLVLTGTALSSEYKSKSKTSTGSLHCYFIATLYIFTTNTTTTIFITITYQLPYTTTATLS